MKWKVITEAKKSKINSVSDWETLYGVSFNHPISSSIWSGAIKKIQAGHDYQPILHEITDYDREQGWDKKEIRENQITVDTVRVLYTIKDKESIDEMERYLKGQPMKTTLGNWAYSHKNRMSVDIIKYIKSLPPLEIPEKYKDLAAISEVQHWDELNFNVKIRDIMNTKRTGAEGISKEILRGIENLLYRFNWLKIKGGITVEPLKN